MHFTLALLLAWPCCFPFFHFFFGFGGGSPRNEWSVVCRGPLLVVGVVVGGGMVVFGLGVLAVVFGLVVLAVFVVCFLRKRTHAGVCGRGVVVVLGGIEVSSLLRVLSSSLLKIVWFASFHVGWYAILRMSVRASAGVCLTLLL